MGAKRHRFPLDVIEQSLYVGFTLNLRDVETLTAEKGVEGSCGPVRPHSVSGYGKHCRLHVNFMAKPFVELKPDPKLLFYRVSGRKTGGHFSWKHSKQISPDYSATARTSCDAGGINATSSSTQFPDVRRSGQGIAKATSPRLAFISATSNFQPLFSQSFSHSR